jgi:hypothetical protein
MKDYYALLGVRQFASSAEIKRAYRRLALKYHPDKNPDPAAEVVIKELNEAYDLLGDPEKKAWYDQLLSGLAPTQHPIEIPPRQRQPAHRDPAYKGTGTHRGPVISKRERLFQIVRHYHPKMLWLSRISLVFSVFFFFDYYLPHRTADENIVDIRSTGSGKQGDDFIFHLSSGKNVKVYRTTFRFREGEQVLMTYTPVFDVPIFLHKVSGGSIRLAYIYTTLWFLPVSLFVVAGMAVMFRHEIEFSFNLIVLNGMLLLINFAFI